MWASRPRCRLQRHHGLRGLGQRQTAAAPFIFSGEGGKIAGWSATVDAAKALTTYTDTAGAVYKGLAIAASGGASFLYAADFRNGKVDVFDSSYARQTASATRFAFSDPSLPAGYAPFGIQAVATGAAGAAQIRGLCQQGARHGHRRDRRRRPGRGQPL
jgi:uncharacterized protein (TIGR03118 family)